MRLGVIDGPGQHGSLLIAQLAEHNHELTHVRAYPRFTVLDAQHREVARWADRAVHDALRRLTSAAQHRLRRWAGFGTSYDFDLYSRVYSKFAAQYLDDVEVVVGFSLVCYDAHKRAHRLGHLTVLELPATHLLSHIELDQEEHNLAGQLPPRTGVVFSRFAIERASREYAQAGIINTLSSYAKQTLVQRGIPSEKVRVTPLGVDVELFHPNEGAQTGRPFRVLCVGRVELVKGIRYLLDALERLRLPEAELWLIGALHEEALPLLKAHSRAIVLHPPMPHDKLAEYYRQADILVFPTISDGFGLVMLEGMASGLPVIATEHSGAPDVIRDGTDGFIVPIRDSEAIAQKILWLYQNPEARIIMGQMARTRAETMFAQKHYGDRLEVLIAAVGKSSGHG